MKVSNSPIQIQKHLGALVTVALAATMAAAMTTGCTRNDAENEDALYPNTGLAGLEQQTGAMALEDAKAGLVAYVSADRIRVRTKPDTSEDTIAGLLNVNDKIQIVDPSPIGQEKFITVRVLESESATPKGVNLFISAKYLDSKPKAIAPGVINTQIDADTVTPQVEGQRRAQANRLFAVTNIATEKLRVYERCLPGESCVNRMLLETEVVNGEDEDGTRTRTGSYRIEIWEKFYEIEGTYPAWYKPGYPAVPKPGNRSAWFDSDYMPNGKGDMRGAFGWYTAKVGPNPAGQWHHGTAGWGADKKDFIVFKDTFGGWFLNLFTNIRSHGCTRVDNETIAYLRNLLPLGTPLVKIYAREAVRDEARSAYSKQNAKWSYILTKNGHQVKNKHQLADRAAVLAAGTPQSEWLDQGTLEIDQHPDIDKGDLYKLGGGAFQGYFVVDEGTVVNYRHPSQIGVGGFKDEVTPSFMISTNSQLSTSAASHDSGGGSSGGARPPRPSTGGGDGGIY